MAINVLISCARKSKDKELIKQYLESNPNIGHIYDCNDTPTDFNRESSKQDEIDRHIREVTDWFIFLCPFDFVGEATFHELQVAVQAKNNESEFPMISLFFSKDPIKELEKCNQSLPSDQQIVMRKDDVSRYSINQYLNEISQYDSKRYDPDYYENENLPILVKEELHRFLNYQLRLRRYETSCSEVLPSDIFFDYNRTKPENGFAIDIYRSRPHDKEMIEAGREHILLCGAPASGKSRSVFEYIKSFGDNPNNKFIVVRGAQNLNTSGVSHRCVSLSRLVDEISKYDEYLDRENLHIISPQDQHLFIIIDQIDSMLGEDLSQLENLFHYASSERRSCYQILLTTTPSGYDANSELFSKLEQMICTMRDGIQSSYRLRTIHISTLSFDDTLWIWNRLGVKDQPIPNGKVIGDYIYKLSSYNNRLIDEARQFHSEFSYNIIPVINSKKIRIQNIVAAFVRSVQLVKQMRHGGQMPLCLVIMTMKEELWQAITELKKSSTGFTSQEMTYTSSQDDTFKTNFALDVQNLLFNYFVHNNILLLSKECILANNPLVDDDDDLSCIWDNELVTNQDSQDTQIVNDLDIDFDQVRDYDHEQMKTIVATDIILTIINDQVWDQLCDYTQYDYNTFRLYNGRLTANTYSRQEAKRAMTVWYNTFGYDTPVATLLRMLIRSPLVKLDSLQGIRYSSEVDNNFSFVWNLFRMELQKIKSPNEKEKKRAIAIQNNHKFPFLYILLVSRMGSISKIKEVIKKKDGTFKPIFMSYDMVSELYGQAFGRAKSLGFLKPLEDDDYCVLARELFTELQNANVNTTETEMLYYHFRQLQLRNRYKDANDYFMTNQLSERIKKNMDQDYDDEETEKHTKQVCGQIMMALAASILADQDFDDWLKKMDDCKMDVSFVNLNAIILLSTRGELNCKLQHKLFREILRKADETVRIPGKNPILEGVIKQYGVVVISQMLKMVPSLISAREILSVSIPWLEENLVSHTKETREVWESLALAKCNSYEYNFLLKDIMNPTDGSIKSFWSQNDILREKLFSCSPNFSDAWELYKRLYVNNSKYKVTPYVFMNIYKNISENYVELEKGTVNRTYECFMQMLEDKGVQTMIKNLIETGEYVNQRAFTKIYNTIVTKTQESHFRGLLGERAWNVFCEQEATNVLRIQKKYIYDVRQVLVILQETVERQLNSNGLIDDSLLNSVVLRWMIEKNNDADNPDVKKLYDYLHELFENNPDYDRRLSKSDTYYKSMHSLGFNEVPMRRFNNIKKQPDRKGYWLDEDYKFTLDLRQAMKKVCAQTQPTEEDVNLMFDYLEKLPVYPKVMPDMAITSLLLRNRLLSKFEKNGREFRDLTPREILLIAKCVFCYRELPITTSIMNNIMEGFANYFTIKNETDQINKKSTWLDFQAFKDRYATYTYFDDKTYFHILKIWPEKLNQYKGEIDLVCHCSERLLNKVIELERTGYSIPGEWHYYYKEIRDVIGQNNKS